MTDTTHDDEIVDLLSVDCQVGVKYAHVDGLIIDILEPALRLMLSRAAGPGKTPPVGSVVTLYMSVTEPDTRIIIPGGVV
jgi:hypothetical protein